MLGLKRPYALLVAALVACCVLVTVAWVSVDRYLDAPLDVPGDGIAFDIVPGTAFAAISRELSKSGVLDFPQVFSWYARLGGQAQSVQAGEYFIETGTTPRRLLQKFVAGDVKLYSFTIVEGWTYREMISALASHAAIENTLVFEDWPAFLETLTTEYDHPEGLFLPETYLFPKYSKDSEVLEQAFDAMQVALAEEWERRDVNLPFSTPYEALILASIIEKETALADERPMISGVFVRRLQKRMRLQTDPTVIYGIGNDFDGNLTRQHLRADTSYNTYTRHGLPPTPIALPGLAAITAAMHPQGGNEIYFVASGLGDGSHKFSATKAEHDAAVREYLSRQRATRIQGK